MRFNLAQEQGSNLSLRVAAGFELPRRALDSPWLSTAAKVALLESLNTSAVPKDVWLGGPTPGQLPTWNIFQARSTTVRARALQADQLGSASRPNCGGGVYLGQAGRELGILLELNVPHRDDAHPVTMSLEQLFEGLLAVVLAGTSALSAVAAALGCGEPTRLKSLTGWLLPPEGRMLKHVLPLNEYERHGHAGSSVGVFPRVRPGSKDPQNMVDVVRAWITAALLDDAVFGFEEDLAAVPTPWWAHLD
jgi:hypothetical protein